MKFFVSTGELSGDLHLSYIVTEMKALDPHAKFYGVAGKNSKKVGVEIIQDISELAIMGVTEALKKYSYLKKKAYEYLEFIKENKIEKVILVDYGGFNLKFLEMLKKELPEVETYYYIPPKLWIWGEKRIKKLKLVDHIVVIFPWEVEFYKKHGVKAIYFGNPFIDKYSVIEDRGNKILLLPGSRKQEVIALLPTLLQVAKSLPEEQFILKLADSSNLDWCNVDMKDYSNVTLETDMELKDAVAQSRVAIAASGTIILELSLLGIPGVAIYKTGFINWMIAKHIIKIGYVTLPNLTLDREVYPELLQERCNPAEILVKLKELEENKVEVNCGIAEVREKLSGDNVIKSYANYILKGTE